MMVRFFYQAFAMMKMMIYFKDVLPITYDDGGNGYGDGDYDQGLVNFPYR